jgi:multiple sugar transport system permease protein
MVTNTAGSASPVGAAVDRRRQGRFPAARRALHGRERLAWQSLAILVGILFLVPFVWLVLTAFVRYGGLDLSTTGGFTTSNFSDLFKNNATAQAVGENVGQALVYSFYLSAGTMIITTAIALFTAYPLSRFNIRGKNAVVYGIVFITGLPIVAIVIPTYDIFLRYNLVDSPLWTILFMTATSLPFAVWIGKNFIDSVPFELEEAAATEGAGTLRTLRYVTMPLVTPGALVIAIYTFIQSWSNFFVPFIFLDTPKLPAAVTIYQFFGQYTVNYGGLAAFSIIFTAVPVVLYVVLSKWSGGNSLFSGAVKG